MHYYSLEVNGPIFLLHSVYCGINLLVVKMVQIC